MLVPEFAENVEILISYFKPKHLLWKRKKIYNVSSIFTGTNDLPDSIRQLQDQYEFCKYFFDDDLIDKLVNESIRYSKSKYAGKPYICSKNDICKYLRICILSSVSSVLKIRMLWNATIGIDIVWDTMSVTRFEEIRTNLHFNENYTSTNDKLHKLRLVIDCLLSKFLSVQMEEMLAIDEQNFLHPKKLVYYVLH